MRTTSASKNSWTTRRKPSWSGRLTSPPLQNVIASNTSKGKPDGTSENAGRVVGEEGRRNRSLRCHKELKNVLQRQQEVYGPTKPRTTPLLSADGSTLLKEKSSIKCKVEGTLQCPAQRTLHCGPHSARPDPTETRDQQPRPPPNDR